MSDRIEGSLIGHCACPLHGGSDSLGLYDKGDYVDGYCWANCGFVSKDKLIREEVLHEDGKQILFEIVSTGSGSKGFVMTEEVLEKVNKVLEKDITGWKERRIPKIVDEFYGVRTAKYEGDVRYRYYQSTQEGDLVGWHVRDDLIKKRKNAGMKPDRPPFFPIGKVRSDCELYGQSLFKKNSKFLIIASGEEDVHAIFTAMNIERGSDGLQLKRIMTPVVSTTVGEAAIKQIRNNYEWVTSHEKVIIMYDNDKAGKEGAEELAKILKPGQAHIAEYRRNDACDHSKRGEFGEIVDTFWKAAKGEPYSPAGIVGSSQTFDALMQRAMFEKIPLPAFARDLEAKFNGGPALGEITTIAAACVDADTEYLTPNGWVKIDEFKSGEIAVIDEDFRLTFEKPYNYINEDCDWMYHFKTKTGVDQMVSANHRMPFIKNGKFKIEKAADVVANHESNITGFRGNFIQVFNTEGGSGLDFTEGELRLQIAVNADGRIVNGGKDNYTQMRFNKKRKYERLLAMCEKYDLKFSDRGVNNQGNYEVIVWPKSSYKSMSNWYSASSEQLEIIADEVLHWDGTMLNDSKVYFQKDKRDVDFIQYVFSSLGFRSYVTSGPKVWECHISKTRFGDSPRGVGMGMSSGASGKSVINKVVPKYKKQYCFTTSTGMWLARRNGNVFVTGNSSVGKGQPLWENVVTPEGYRKVGEIKVGDYLIGKNGSPTKVLGVFPQGLKPVYRVTMKDGSVAHCDDSHLWTWKSSIKGSFKTTSVTEMKDFLDQGNNVILPLNEGVEFSDKDLTSFDIISSKEGIPKECLTMPFDERLNLLNKLIDDSNTYSTNSFVYAMRLKSIARSLGYCSKVCDNDGMFEVVVDFTDFDQVESVELVGEHETVCFKVDAEDELYLTNDFIVTHNTTISNEFLYHWIFNAPYKVGVIPLESDLGEITENLMSIQTSTKLANLDDDEKKTLYATAEFKENYNKLVCTETGEDRYYILDHQGAVTDGSLFNKIEYMVKVLGCKIIILDPLTLALSGEGNEGMDAFMSKLLRFVKREMISVVNIVHVRKSQSGARANSRGAEISEEDIKGCLDHETEYLSPNGWVKMNEYDGGLVAQYNHKGVLEFVRPSEYMSIKTDKDFIRFHSDSVDMCLSENHRAVVNGEFILAKDLKENCEGFITTTTEEGLVFYQNLKNCKIEAVKGNGFMYCFSVPSECFVARRNGKMFVTGNSGSVFQVSMNVILLMRDKVHENERVRNTTKVVTSKNRRCGKTGPSGFWFYDQESGRLQIGSDPESDDVDLSDALDEFESVGAFAKGAVDDENLKTKVSEDDWEIMSND